MRSRSNWVSLQNQASGHDCLLIRSPPRSQRPRGYQTGADVVTIDGQPGGTRAAPMFIKASTSVPTLFAHCRAREELDRMGATGNVIDSSPAAFESPRT